MPIPGTTRIEHLDELLDASRLVLTQSERDTIEAAFPIEAAAGDRYTAQTTDTVHQSLIPMIRISILYPSSHDATFDFDYYRHRHAPLVLARLGAYSVSRWELDRVISEGGSRAPHIGVAHFYAADLMQLKAGLEVHAAELLADVPHFTNASPVLQISEILVSSPTDKNP